jgi:hypothetical protein
MPAGRRATRLLAGQLQGDRQMLGSGIRPSGGDSFDPGPAVRRLDPNAVGDPFG